MQVLTLQLSLVGSVTSFFLKYWPEIVIVVLGDILAILVAEMLYERIHERRVRPKVTIKAINGYEGVEGDMGFAVTTENKTLKNTRVKCNGLDYDWQTKEGKRRQVDICVGDEPFVFFPFIYGSSWLEDANKLPAGVNVFQIEDTEFSKDYMGNLGSIKAPEHLVRLFTIMEIQTKRTVFQFGVVIPKTYIDKQFADAESRNADGVGIRLNDWSKYLGKLPISIRLISEVIEEKKDYDLEVSIDSLLFEKDEKGLPRIGYACNLKEK